METDIASMWHMASSDEQAFIRMFALFLATWLKQHGSLLEQDQANWNTHKIAMEYALMISRVDDKELFKIILEFWSSLAGDLYNESLVMIINSIN